MGGNPVFVLEGGKVFCCAGEGMVQVFPSGAWPQFPYGLGARVGMAIGGNLLQDLEEFQVF